LGIIDNLILLLLLLLLRCCCCCFVLGQVETKGCLEAIDDVLAVPGITCAFLGECQRPAGNIACQQPADHDALLHVTADIDPSTEGQEFAGILKACCLAASCFGARYLYVHGFLVRLSWLLCNIVHVVAPVCALHVRLCFAAGPADMGLSLGFHVKHGYDLPAMLASSDMEPVYTTVVEVSDAQQLLGGQAGGNTGPSGTCWSALCLRMQGVNGLNATS
jgi:hypothetical protein